MGLINVRETQEPVAVVADILDFEREVRAERVGHAQIIVDDEGQLEIRIHAQDVARGGVMAARLAGIGQSVSALRRSDREHRWLARGAGRRVSRT